MVASRMPRIGPSLRLLFICALPLVVLIVALAVDQFGRQRMALLADLARLTGEQHHAVETMLAGTDQQLARMRLTMERRIAQHGTGLSRANAAQLMPVVAETSSGEIRGLEWRPAQRNPGVGNLIAVEDLAERATERTGPADAALSLLATLQLESSIGSISHWSYFFSAAGDFITILPGASLQDFVGSAGPEAKLRAVDDLIAGWLGYSVFTLGMPDANPRRESYWTEIYDDAGGGGPMVSHAAPVYVGDRFHGIVGTDILLERFDALLRQMRQPVGMLAIVDARDAVLAINGSAFGGDATAMRDYLLSNGFLERSRERFGGTTFRNTAESWVLSRPLRNSPFRLLYVIPQSNLNALLLPRFGSYGLILVGLGATLAFMLYFLHRSYIAPSFRLAGYLGERAAGAQPALPPLPKAWRSSFEAISEAFSSTERYQTRLEESEARFAAAASSLVDGFAIAAPDGRIAFHNQRFADFFAGDGMSQPLSGQKLEDHLPADWFVEGAAAPHPLRERWIACRRSPMPDGGTVILARDVTSEKEAELRLRESEARYRTVVNTQTELVARYAPDGKTTFTNDAYCRYMKMTNEEILGRDTSDFTYIVEEDRDRHEAHVRSLTPAEPTRTIEFRSILPDGTLHWEEWTDTGIFDETGELFELQSVGRDITERKLAQEALSQSEARLHQSEKLAALGSLLAGVAHELNNPLSVVVGYSSMLRELAADDATKRRAEAIHAAAERCARIVKTFLAMARSKPVEKSVVAIDSILDDVVELAAYGLRSNGVEVLREPTPDLPPVLADSDQLHQVFMNLVLNAQQAMMEVGGPRRLRLVTGVEAGNILIDIIDTGPGIRDEVRQRAFEPFFTTKPQGVGTGIGLAVCLGIVKAHGGTITLDRLPGGGTICRVVLPATAATSLPEGAAPSERISLRGRVLVVDDEPDIVALISEALTQDGLDVTALSSGREAQEAIAREQFDVVVTDLRMPDIGGERLLASIAELRPDLSARVIVMTGDALGSEITLERDVVTILEKPIALDTLREVISRVLDANANAATD